MSPHGKANLVVEQVAVAHHRFTDNKSIGCSGLVGNCGSRSWRFYSWKIDCVGVKDIQEMRCPEVSRAYLSAGPRFEIGFGDGVGTSSEIGSAQS